MKLHRATPLLATTAFLLAACGSGPKTEPVGRSAKEEIVAVSASNHLLRFNAGQPQQVRERKPLQGLRANERIVGIDFRVARRELFALASSGQLYKIDMTQARAMPVGSPAVLPSAGATEWAFDFNPTVDRIRVANNAGFSLRLHPDTGAIVDADPAQDGVQFDRRLAYDAKDTNDDEIPRIVGAAYTYNKQNDKITTNYALDGERGTLVHQGTKEGVTPDVSPNTGRLYTVGRLGIGRFAHATFDIAGNSPTAYAGVHNKGDKATRWYRIDLATGKASFIGTVGGGEPLVGAAIEP